MQRKPTSIWLVATLLALGACSADALGISIDGAQAAHDLSVDHAIPPGPGGPGKGGPGKGGPGPGGPGPVGDSNCQQVVECSNGCITATCEPTCIGHGTASAQATYNALVACLGVACPLPNTDGGTGATCLSSLDLGESTMSCNACFQSSQSVGGACEKTLEACIADGG